MGGGAVGPRSDAGRSLAWGIQLGANPGFYRREAASRADWLESSGGRFLQRQNIAKPFHRPARKTPAKKIYPPKTVSPSPSIRGGERRAFPAKPRALGRPRGRASP